MPQHWGSSAQRRQLAQVTRCAVAGNSADDAVPIDYAHSLTGKVGDVDVAVVVRSYSHWNLELGEQRRTAIAAVAKLTVASKSADDAISCSDTGSNVACVGDVQDLSAVAAQSLWVVEASVDGGTAIASKSCCNEICDNGLVAVFEFVDHFVMGKTINGARATTNRHPRHFHVGTDLNAGNNGLAVNAQLCIPVAVTCYKDILYVVKYSGRVCKVLRGIINTFAVLNNICYIR